jgi:hypothetical protein
MQERRKDRDSEKVEKEEIKRKRREKGSKKETNGRKGGNKYKERKGKQ